MYHRIQIERNEYLHAMNIRPIIIIATTLCALILCAIILFTHSLFISQRVPDDVVVTDNKYVAVGFSTSGIDELYQWPDDEYHRQLFHQWWSQTKHMGTNSIITYAPRQYRLHFSRELSIAFNDENSDLIEFTYSGKQLDGDRVFYREALDSDRELMRECIKIAHSAKKINSKPLHGKDVPDFRHP